MIDEWDAGVLSVHAMAGDAVMRERFLAVLPVFVGIRQGVLLFFVADKKVMLGEGDRLRLELAGRSGFTTGQPHYATGNDYCYGKAHILVDYVKSQSHLAMARTTEY